MKVIFFDVDGTILSHATNSIPSSTIQALDLLKDQGILRVLCTGRHMKELKQLELSYMDFDAYILLNGQLILDHKQDLIYGNPVSDLTPFQTVFDEKKIPIQILEKEDFYINFVNENVIRAQNAIHTPVPDIQECLNEPIYQGILFIDSSQEEDMKLLFKDYELTRWNPFAVDVISKNMNKGKAIDKFLEIFSIPKEDSMAFGDGENDIDMLKHVQIGVAMGNACDALKEIADYITTDIDDHGIYNALKQLMKECKI